MPRGFAAWRFSGASGPFGVLQRRPASDRFQLRGSKLYFWSSPLFSVNCAFVEQHCNMSDHLGGVRGDFNKPEVSGLRTVRKCL